MQTAFVVQGRMVGPTTIELDEPVTLVTGQVEIVVRRAVVVPSSEERLSLLEIIDRLPPGTRTAEDINAQVEEEKQSWE